MVGKQPIRLPALKVLRVKQAGRSVENPCVAIMSSVLACWASAGYNAAGCMAIETQLRQCMDGPKAPTAKMSAVNYHLGRMQKYVTNKSKAGKKVK